MRWESLPQRNHQLRGSWGWKCLIRQILSVAVMEVSMHTMKTLGQPNIPIGHEQSSYPSPSPSPSQTCRTRQFRTRRPQILMSQTAPLSPSNSCRLERRTPQNLPKTHLSPFNFRQPYQQQHPQRPLETALPLRHLLKLHPIRRMEPFQRAATRIGRLMDFG